MGDPVDGVVRVERREQGWLHVQVGRGKYVKRFNLRDTEARQLVEQIARFVDIRSVMGLTGVLSSHNQKLSGTSHTTTQRVLWLL